MGDILGSIFGTSTATEQETVPDVVQQEMNRQRLNQVVNLFQSGALNQFADAQPGVYSQTDLSRYLSDTLRDDIARTDRASAGNLMSLAQYRNSFNPVTANYNRSLGDINRLTGEGIQKGYDDYAALRDMNRYNVQSGLDRSYSDYGTGMARAGEAYSATSAGITDDYNKAIARGDFDYARALLTNEAYANRSLGIQDLNRDRALELGIGTTGNYIDQIARPRLEQVAVLQGLERGGMLPAAIARATAETAMPYLQSVESAYATNQANTLNALMAQQGALGQSTAEGNRALGASAMGERASAGNVYQNNIAQLAQALMANNITLEQAGISADSALGQQLVQTQNALRLQQQQGIVGLANTYNPLAANFATSLPGASAQLSLLPGQQQAQRTANLTALQPLADFPRQLNEADFLRRQGLFTSVYTGIPFQAGSTTFGGSATGNIFDQLGGTIQSGFTGGGSIGGVNT